jgi:hypothetical protein
MKKSNFNFDVLDVPVSIKNKLIELSTSIDINKRSRKGSNGWDIGDVGKKETF